MNLGTQTGSLVNHILAAPAHPAPAVGMGATVLLWTDRNAATIVKVTPNQVHVQVDHAERTDKNGMSDAQSYAYTPNPSAPVKIFRRNKRGEYVNNGDRLAINTRRTFHDYSF
jgi:hypothetical protein